MQFQVPQFIDIEDKIFGPFSFKQFMYLLGGGGLAFVFYKLLPIFVAVPLMIGIIILAISLTFYRPNGRPFIAMAESWFYFMLGGKLYVWRKAPPKAAEKKSGSAASEIAPISYVPKLSSSKLHDLSWSLNVLDANKKNNSGS